MKMPKLSRCPCLAITLLALGSFVPLGGQEPGSLPEASLPLDTKAIFRTHVPHTNTQLSDRTGSGAAPTRQSAAGTFSGSPYSVGSTVTVTTTAPAAEEHIAVDPLNPATLVAAISDFAIRGGYNTTKYAYSTDSGASWHESYLEYDADGFLVTGDDFLWLANSDPVVAMDKAGHVYLLSIFIGILNDNGIYVSRASSIGGAVQFTAQETFPIATNPDLLSTVFEDKPWMTVDNSASAHGGNLYASWSRFIGDSTDMIVFSRSTDQGLTWSPAMALSPPAQNGAVQGSQVSVGPKGEVYVAYELFYVGGKRQHFLTRSLDGGQTFSTPAAVTPLFNELSFNSTYRKNSFSSLAVSPTTGMVCLAYADQPGGSVGAQVEFIHWTPGIDPGFSAPRVINDKSGGHQFFPALTVDLEGVIHASWFDTRNSSKRSSRYDIYAARSLDHGATFSPNSRVTAGLVNAGSASFIGDYAGIAAGGGSAHPVWTSGGFNNGRLQTATLE